MSESRLGEGRMDRRSFLRLGVGFGGALAGLSLLGCQPAAPTAKKDLYTLNFGGVGSFVSTALVPFFVASKKGYFAEEGIQFQWVDFSGAGNVSRALEAGEVKAINAGISNTVNAFMKGAPFKVLSGVNAAAGSIVFIVPASSPIKSLKDIKGKSVSMSSPGGLSDFFVRRSLKFGGYAAADVKVVAVGSPTDSWTAAKTGIVDVAYATDGLAQSLVAKGEARLAWNSLEVVPVWQDNWLCTTDSFVKENPDVLRGLVRALQKGDEFTANNGDEAAQLWIQDPNVQDISLDLAKTLIKAYPKGAFTTKLSLEGLKIAEEGMRDMALVKPGEKIPWDKLIDQQFLPENMRIDVSKLTG